MNPEQRMRECPECGWGQSAANRKCVECGCVFPPSRHDGGQVDDKYEGFAVGDPAAALAFEPPAASAAAEEEPAAGRIGFYRLLAWLCLLASALFFGLGVYATWLRGTAFDRSLSLESLLDLLDRIDLGAIPFPFALLTFLLGLYFSNRAVLERIEDRLRLLGSGRREE